MDFVMSYERIFVCLFIYFIFSVQPDPQGCAVPEGACRVAHHCGPHVSAVQTQCTQRRGRVHPTHYEHHRAATFHTAEVGYLLCLRSIIIEA